MTIFITEFFKLDLTHLNVTFSEENSFFEKDLIKQQSFPFNVPYERSYIPFYDFVSSHNSQNANKYIKGVLFRNDKYFEAELLIISVSKTIKSVIYYSFDKLTIFDTKLSDLPWPTINVGTNVFDFANLVKLQNYPDTKINFVQIHDPEKYADYEFGSKVDFINHHESTEGFSEYVPNPLNLPFRFFKMNEMRPFIYIKEILQFIFEQINYIVSGNFLEDSKISKALQYHNNSIFYTNNNYNFEDELNLTLNQSIVSGYSPTTTAYNEYIVSKTIAQKGSYKVTLELEGELSLSDYGNFYLKCYFNNQIISGRTAAYANYNTDGSQYTFNKSLEFKFDVPEGNVGSTLEFRFICNPFIKETIEGNYELTGTLRPLYKDAINLKDLLPDQTVGEYINAIKESFVLRTDLNTNTQNVTFSFFNSDDGDQEIIDISKYEVFQTPRQLNLSVGYKVQFNDDSTININKKGEFVTADEGFTIINLPIEPLPSIYIETQPYVQHQDALALFFYEANENARPLLIDDNENSYNRLGFVHQFQRQWLYQNLNSEEYNLNVDLPLYMSSKINAKSKLWFYNNFFIVHNLKRFSKNNLFERMNFRLFKLKSYPQFNFVIDGGTDFEPPIAFTSYLFGALVTEFSTKIIPGQIGNPSYFSIDIFGNQSSDPQGLSLSFGWEVLSSPDGSTSGVFLSQNTAHSITRFTHSTYLHLIGIYQLKLTVVNSEGLSNSIDFSVHVNDEDAPDPRVVLLQTNVGSNNFLGSLNFTPLNNTGTIEAQNVDVNYTTGAVTPIGSVITFDAPNLSLGANNIILNLPSANNSSWYVKLIVDNIESYDKPLAGASLPYYIY
jgi:hypothetical protein